MAFMLSPLLKRYTWNSAWLYYCLLYTSPSPRDST
ncbi:hypothetical protein ACX3VG_15740, partial [Escherichia coli]